MKELLSQAIKSLDKLDTRLDSIDKTLVKQEENLKEHMRRTELLEAQVKPLESHSIQIKTATKITTIVVPILCTIAGLVYKYLVA